MRRNTHALANDSFDLVIIGGGAFGAAAAHEASLRGLKTALIERRDFGGGASAECFKMVHGGIRYLQHADVRRLRHSCHERSAFLRIAPHLVAPLPVAIPTYGHGRNGKLLLGAGATVYDVLTLDRNRGIRDPQRRIARTQFMSKGELTALFPHLAAPSLTGAVVFQDGQMHNPARLVLAFVKSAAASGATVCNYVEATGFVWDGNAVRGVKARDTLSGSEFQIRSRLVLNAAGPWAEYLFQDAARFGSWRRRPFSRDAYFIVDRKPTSRYAIAVQGLSVDRDARFGRGTRHLFAVPWRDRTLFGVWHRLHAEYPDSAQVDAAEISAWIRELNTVYPQLDLSLSEVSFAHCGLVPFGDTATESELSFGKESQFIDHRHTHGIAGLATVIGIRFTTARADASRALNMLLEQWPSSVSTAATDELPLAGGNIPNFAAFRRDAEQSRPPEIPRVCFESLLRNYGTEYRKIMEMQTHCNAPQLIPGTQTLTAEISHAVTDEMSVRLEDVVMRRTDLAAGVHPGVETIRQVASVMSNLCQWSRQREQQEIEHTLSSLQRHRAGANLTPLSECAVPRATLSSACA